MFNNDTEQQLQEVKLTIEQAKANIDRKNQLYRLLDNKDFQEIIQVGYLHDEAVRLVQALSDANMQTKEHQKHLHKMINGLGCLQQYLAYIERQGLGAEGAIKQHEETREDLLREELENAEVGARA